MSGSYDYPRASSSSSRRVPRPNRPNDPPHLHYLRNLISERNRSGAYNAYNATRALETLDQEALENSLDRALFDRTDLDQPRTAAGIETEQFEVRTFGPTGQLRSIWLDPEQSQSLRSPEPNSIRNLPLWQAYRRPSSDGSSSRSPSLMPPSGQSGQSAQSSRDGQGRMKRRKLDADDNREEFRGFNYGHYGQVVPGILRMRVVSCDGGSYDPESSFSRVENVLDNNTSVYSTREDRCNILLTHQGEAPFCLKKIVIKAPHCGFDAPIQEGMVFVAMTSDELLTRTTESQIQYSHGGPYRRPAPRRSGMQPSQEYLSGYRPPLQNLERTVLVGPNSASVPHTSEDPQAQFRITTEYGENNEDSGDDEDWRAALLESTQAEQTENPPSDTDEPPTDDEEPSTRLYRRFEYQRRRLEALSASMDGDVGPGHVWIRGRSFVPPAEPSPSTAEVLMPHARFFIEREKSMVTIKFDPPPSGRFILIKLWNPRADSNLDIQSIIVHGYAGPRFFPSLAAR
ncbi:uncharacterized protein N7515_002989 [Penicillium bovifimosum]|uniref:Uncharacterized protein n=1 Tax=Penicillium bovifimosum TaxID=126998 RepID=A0A9W9HCR6_9EURO|nr:uncharacterized protein N7515_002989 [Penicillium bovifimosum]KAJ5144202.1 hypothetical protein N7515_002989 [Penicillium bovifimosum]